MSGGLARGWSVALVGVTGQLVSVEADVGSGLPGFALLGLPDAALNESRDRVRAAVVNTGEEWPKHKVTVSMSPADLHKRGSRFDLALAVVVLAADGKLPVEELEDRVLLGELGLDGGLRQLRGVLPAVTAAARAGIRRVVVPEPNAAEAALVDGVEVVGVRSLGQLLAMFRGDPVPEAPAVPCIEGGGPPAVLEMPDLVDVRGHAEARLALEVAAAGGHHIFLHGSPGAGKTMLASRLPGLLPRLSRKQALEVTEIHSVAGLLPPAVPLVTAPPFCQPHHSATLAAMVGGGTVKEIRPGAAAIAHHGVIFIDEATEYRPGVLDSLRQPLESGEVVIARSGITARFPAQFQMVMAANPCPCGAPSGPRSCTCTSDVRRRYAARLSRPLLDRIDIQVMVDRPSRYELLQAPDGETSAVVASRVLAARQRAEHRLRNTSWSLNGQVSVRALRLQFQPDATAMRLVEAALDRGSLSARGMAKVLRVAWSMADLAGLDRPGMDEVGMALAFRAGAQGGWT
ncbi:YifB family Mg chelatase-like AAA ATPase [Sporichthya sp.]|uniref:YifB family Mg chelatase-like AAA ATPase n=1 Tax=Sporichthya sp. TaxID=65475 RepID=UPI0017EB8810|nr:YifB family Mg chelatase-like AAA ATPase [Sporichthya sp.]MBA3744429.1 YifB family Mg chelatase-like AAA ATPase [Sporichthya sp.]